jgi:SAM-dependent methyltransferase
MLLCLEEGMRVLEVSEDGGEQAAALRGTGAEVVCLRPSRGQANALEARGFAAIVSDSASVSAVEAGRFDAVVLSVTRGGRREPGSAATDLDALLGEIAASLRPGGLLVLSLSNPLFRVPGLAGLLGWLTGATAARPRSGWRVAFRRPVRTRNLQTSLLEAHFGEVRAFAPLPEAGRPKFLVPIGDANAIDYFFRFLMPRTRGASRRALLRLGRLVMKPGLFERLVPAYEFAAVKASES